MGNNNKMTENDVQMVRMQKHVKLCWFETFRSFRVKGIKLLSVIFWSRIDGKQQHNNQKFCAKDLVEKCSYLGLVSIFGMFSCLASCTFALSIF